uniref:Peptidase S1 domain-containing protein n=1 Tax=Anopheles dirus TaxID=7168 RepID=A0A2C9GVA2_9DIPT
MKQASAKTFRWFFINLLIVQAVQYVQAMERGETCIIHPEIIGKCILARECSAPRSDNKSEGLLKQGFCGKYQGEPMACCAVSNMKTTLPERPVCGVQISDRLYGGQLTELDDDPWTALIEYQKPDGSFGFHCGGSLINEYYVLTAAHCIQAIPPGWKVHRVRLGEWDLESIHDCEFPGGLCNEPPIDVDIEKIIVHHGYEDRNGTLINDIALIRFKRQVNFTETVRPICLPLSPSIRGAHLDGVRGYVSGWGNTQTGTAHEKKLRAGMIIKGYGECESFYKQQGVELMPTHMCAGKINLLSKCSGDSGGSLMRGAAGTWYLVGVDSFGVEKCGSSEMPRVYTNVSKFIDWIGENI